MQINYTIIGEFSGKAERRKMRRNIRKTGKKKAVAVISLALILGMTGCAGKDAAPETTQENVSAEDGTQKKAEQKVTEQKEAEGGPEDGYGTDAPITQGNETKREEPDSVQETDNSASEAEEPKETEETSRTLEASQGIEHLGGKVQNPQADGMTFAQTTLVDEEGMVTLLDVQDAKKIPVKFTEETKMEHWIIQGGGAGIDMQNAAVSDLKEGMGVELEGYFDGETFVATKVIIEEYV